MKFIICFLSTILTLATHAQVNKAKKTNSENQPMFFLDSVRITKDQLYFDPNKIQKIDVVKSNDATNESSGKIYITSKNRKDFNFLSLADIQKLYAKTNAAPSIFMLNEEILKDTGTFKIDSSYILKVEITKGSEINYLKNIPSDLIILRIITRTKENLDKQNRINIRGTETSLK